MIGVVEVWVIRLEFYLSAYFILIVSF